MNPTATAIIIGVVIGVVAGLIGLTITMWQWWAFIIGGNYIANYIIYSRESK
jgi:hypothetical protein